jgi:hypothetical protein
MRTLTLRALSAPRFTASGSPNATPLPRWTPSNTSPAQSPLAPYVGLWTRLTDFTPPT